MTDRELMQMALDAMESFENGTNGLYKGEFAEERKALHDRLAQPDGPVMYLDQKTMTLSKPLKHEWVGLTDEEMIEANHPTTDTVWCWMSEWEEIGLPLARAIEAKLKEKNT